MKKIILASQSPRRKQLLEWAEVDFTVAISDADESYPEGMGFAAVAMYIAENKAKTITAKLGVDIPVLAADTIVICNNEHLGKPANETEAIEMLKKLSGNMHEVITGVCIIAGQKKILFSDLTRVHFHELTNDQIQYYVQHYKPMDKAGGYAIQEWIGVVGIKAIEGDFYNVMGLPVSRVLQVLQTL